MSAFRPRTSFAAPFIVTVAACSSGSGDKPKPEPRPAFAKTWHVSMHDMKCFATQVVRGNPPAPQEVECPPGMTGNMYMTLAQVADARCAVVPAGCTEIACAAPATPCPLPYGEQIVRKLAYVWTIEKRGDKCHAEEEDHDCPPGVDCNPPAPRTFACPAGVTEDQPMKFAELPNTTCVIVPEGCDNTGCATETIPCPPMR
jgi:hypothetical protein